MEKGPISQFITHHYRHFNSASLVDAAKAYEDLLNKGGKMFLAMAGAMSTAELGLSLAEMIRQDKISFVCCSANNLEEDIMNLVAHTHYYRVPGYRDLTPQQEQELLDNHYNRVTDTCIPEEEAFRRLEGHLVEVRPGAVLRDRPEGQLGRRRLREGHPDHLPRMGRLHHRQHLHGTRHPR